MARIDEAPEERYESPVTFEQIIECPKCEEEDNYIFVTELFDVEQMTEPPEGDFECSNCEHKFHAVFDGWTNYGDAG